MNITEDQIRKIVTDYKIKRDQCLKPLKDYRKQTEQGLNYGQHEAAICNECYANLTDSREYKEFTNLTDQVNENPGLDKVFNPIFGEIVLMNILK